VAIVILILQLMVTSVRVLFSAVLLWAFVPVIQPANCFLPRLASQKPDWLCAAAETALGLKAGRLHCFSLPYQWPWQAVAVVVGGRSTQLLHLNIFVSVGCAAQAREPAPNKSETNLLPPLALDPISSTTPQPKPAHLLQVIGLL